ncbi:MAG TPA: UDP-2,3-diacylglucosamine diphosphatase, partial [Gemmatimonadales bacterium]
MSLPALGQQLVMVSDAHLGAAPAATEEAVFAFLEQVPSLGDCLLVNGDLFDFWFAYRQVIPRRGFRIASVLAALRRKVPIVMTGGNHDRWGDSFWEQEAGIRFGGDSLRFEAGGRTVLALHGDGLTEQHRGARFMHWLTRNRPALACFRLIPPDLSFGLVDRLSGHLGDSTRDPAVLDRAASAQKGWAESRLREDPSLGLVVMGHTHRPALSEPFPG